MRILSIGKTLQHGSLAISSIKESELATYPNIEEFNYIIIHGGDGTIRRVIKTLHTMQHKAQFILNPTGSFNVIAKLHRVPKLITILQKLEKEETLACQTQDYYSLNDEMFLFSAGNMGDLQHIFLSETLRFGILEKGVLKYILSALFLLPVHLLITPFMLLSKRKFFIFAPAGFIPKFGRFYGKVEEMEIDLQNDYNFIELDGDVVHMDKRILNIGYAGTFNIVTA